LPIQDYAAIGDGRTIALVGLDGAIDWLCLPNMDSPSACGALLDAEKGGSFQLEPVDPYEASRRYLERTNVLETTFETAGGVARVTDAMTLPHPGLAPGRELVRRIEGLSGRVQLRWCVKPRFGYGGRDTQLGLRAGVPIASAGQDAISVSSWDAGDPTIGDDEIKATLEESYKIAEALGMNGTPSYVVGSDVVVGAVGLKTLKEKVNNARCGKATC